MSRAILVLEEMPSKCHLCPMSRFVSEISDDNNSIYCFFNRYIGAKYKTTEWDADRPQWCPLKEMPKRKEYYIDEVYGDMYELTDSAYVNGWNNCLEEIEK